MPVFRAVALLTFACLGCARPSHPTTPTESANQNPADLRFERGLAPGECWPIELGTRLLETDQWEVSQFKKCSDSAISIQPKGMR
jgi:hypothetical protein